MSARVSRVNRSRRELAPLALDHAHLAVLDVEVVQVQVRHLADPQAAVDE